MKPPASTRLLLTIAFAIPAYWTPEQALAVFELLDDLKEMIGNHYSMRLFEEAPKQYAPATTDQSQHNPPDDPDDPFVWTPHSKYPVVSTTSGAFGPLSIRPTSAATLQSPLTGGIFTKESCGTAPCLHHTHSAPVRVLPKPRPARIRQLYHVPGRRQLLGRPQKFQSKSIEA